MVIITSKTMAETYGNRIGRHALHEVRGILKYYKDSPQTVSYWQEVLACLELRFPNKE